MTLDPPEPQTGIPRPDVGDVVNDMLFDERVRWISIVFRDTANGEDRFEITPWVTDPQRAVAPE